MSGRSRRTSGQIPRASQPDHPMQRPDPTIGLHPFPPPGARPISPSTLNPASTITDLRPGTTLGPMVTPTQPDDANSLADSIVTTRLSTISRADNTIASYRDQDLHSTSRSNSHSSRLPEMMINTFPVAEFEAYIQWFSEIFGNKKMLLSLDCPTLRTWMREHFPVSSFQEVHHLPLMPPPVLLSTFGYVQAQHAQSDFIELMVIIQYINHQLSTNTAFPWSLETYFAFRMNQYPRTQADYVVPSYPSSLVPPQYTPHSSHVATKYHSRTAYGSDHSDGRNTNHTTAPRMLSPHGPFYSIASHKGTFHRQPVAPGNIQTRSMHGTTLSVYGSPRYFNGDAASVISATTSTLKDEIMSSSRRNKEEFASLYAQPKTRSNIASDKLQWDGHRSSFPAFANDLEGNMIRIGLGYMFEAKVQEAYAEQGLDMAHDPAFWNT